MRLLILILCIIAVSALPPRQYKKISERKLEVTTEKDVKEDPVKTPKEEPKAEEKKEAEEKSSVRAYFENQSVNVVSSTSATIVDKDSQEKQYLPQINYALPQVNIGRPQINVNPMQHMVPQQYSSQNRPEVKRDDDDAKKVYTVNVYVNFPNEHDDEYEDEECRNGKCWGKAKCKDGQISVKGVCTNKQ